MTKSRNVTWKDESNNCWITPDLKVTVSILQDIASRLNENRKSLNKLFDMIEKKEIEVVIVSFKNGLTRFSFRYLERFSSHNFGIEVVDGEKPKNYQELVEGLIASVSSFAGKLYRMRGCNYKKAVEGVEQLVTERAVDLN